jgi:hypothetical protein
MKLQKANSQTFKCFEIHLLHCFSNLQNFTVIEWGFNAATFSTLSDLHQLSAMDASDATQTIVQLNRKQ